MILLETKRLLLRKLSNGDAPFLLQLFNEPSFLRNIGDRGVRTLADAVQHIEIKMMESYERLGYGLYLAQRKTCGSTMGICGLVKREPLEHADVGFAFLPEFWGRGCATEAAQAVVEYARDQLRMARLFGVASEDNGDSIRVLEKIGLRYERMVQLGENEQPCKLFAIDL